MNKSATDDELNISFRPSPNYAALAVAATGSASERVPLGQSSDWMHGVRARNVGELKAALDAASERVGESGKGMLIEVLM